MDVDRNEKIWAYASTGTRMHAFVQAWADKDGKQSTNHLRAMCRGTIARHKDSRFVGHNEADLICTRCVKLACAMWDRAEASMQPATEADDLGYVAPVDERTEPVIIARDEAHTIRIRAERQQARRIDAAHAEALAIENEDREAMAVVDRILSDREQKDREAEAYGAVEVGASFEKRCEFYEDGALRTGIRAVVVHEVFEGYTDPWTREKHDTGVRFTLYDNIGMTRHSLSLDEFVNAWVH